MTIGILLGAPHVVLAMEPTVDGADRAMLICEHCGARVVLADGERAVLRRLPLMDVIETTRSFQQTHQRCQGEKR